MSLQDKLKSGTASLPHHVAEIAATLPPHLKALVEALPERLMNVVASAPVYSGRRSGADLLTQHVFPVSHRSLEVWPIPWQHVNGKAIAPTVVYFAVGYSKLVAAPLLMGGQRGAAGQYPASSDVPDGERQSPKVLTRAPSTMATLSAHATGIRRARHD
jgi:hypothetical protein